MKTPWHVLSARLRPQFDSMIVEIVDDDGNVVLPWSGFDATGLTHNNQKKLAKKIVDAVNRSETQHGK